MSKRRTSSRTGKLFVVSAPSGGGKTSLSGAMLRSVRGLARSISMTTREPRKGERHGRDYFFVTDQKFRKLRAQHGFLEDANVFGFRYGTPKAYVNRQIRQGKDVLLLIDVQGAMQIRKKLAKASVLIFIVPPSFKELKRRLKHRSTDSRQVIQKRLRIASREMKYQKRYDYVIENRNFNTAVDALKSVITAERLKVE